MAIKYQPLQNLVIIKPGMKEEMSRGGIVIPDSAQEKSQEGEVIAIGPGRMDKDGKHEMMSVKVGDRVVYPRFGGTELKESGEEYVIMPESQILAKIV